MSAASPFRLEDFHVRKRFGPNPWAVVYAPADCADRVVTVYQPHPGGDTRVPPVAKPATFARKRDALAWMTTELPALLAAENEKRGAGAPPKAGAA